MVCLRPSHLDRRFTIMLIWERRQLDEATKAGDEAKALKQQKKVRHLKDLLSLRRSFMEKKRVDDASTRKFLRRQIECMKKLSAEMGLGAGGQQRVQRSSGLESFGSMREEIEAIERDAASADMDVIVARMQGLLPYERD